MKLSIVILLSLFFISGCDVQTPRLVEMPENLQTQLPAEMPERISIHSNESGWMGSSYKKIKIDGGVLEYEKLNGVRQTEQKWSANVAREDLANLYKIFVENKFDTIRNDKPEKIINDAGSEVISISVAQTQSYSVRYGENTPLSAVNLERYRAVKSALDGLIQKYQTAN